ncbi:MAG TPA: beta-ribofuranosylaminobenzene 5'-phosphate synthase [Methanotrichaceae archaeon]|nr:beta-ribofuranosylaminobenzene 5'-phosphate synthase [Methanotrichaceae archaeon]
MPQSSSLSVAKKISELESMVGKLSPVQKMLLGTDGSVTSLLEIITGSPIEIETLAQRVVPAEKSVAAELMIQAGDEVNHRIVKLKRADTGETLIYAVSHAPLMRLDPYFKDDLLRADIPIGVILKRHRIESRRDITGATVLQADREIASVFNIFPRETMLSRNYTIIRHGEPLIAIRETFPYNSFQDEHRVVVETPSRIHITLTDLTGSCGRVDGGVGITLDEPNIVLEAERSEDLTVIGENADRARAAAQAVREHFGLGGARLSIRGGYRMHVGLGGGTQLGIAAGKAISELYNRSATAREIAGIINRGGTSGIGTAAFEVGGFIIDGGHSFGPGKEKMDFRPSSASEGIRPPHAIAHHDFPVDWKILLAIPDIPKGAHGQKEVDIFREYCPVPLADVHELCYQILVKMMPSLVEANLDEFGSAVNRVQELGFKKIEVMLQHPLVRRLMEQMREAGAACAGLSSFGPTVYAITDTQTRDIEAAAFEAMQDVGGDVLITRSRNEGARVRTTRCS